MSTIKADVLQSVSHGAHHLHIGETAVPLPTGVFNTLKELGFVKEASDEAAPAAKMAAPVDNKMADPVANKAVKTAKAK